MVDDFLGGVFDFDNDGDTSLDELFIGHELMGDEDDDDDAELSIEDDDEDVDE